MNMPVRVDNAVYGADQFVAAWVSERIGEPCTGSAIGFLSPRTGQLGAGIVYFDYRGDDVTVGLAVTDRATVTRTMLHHCVRYPFRQLKCARLTAFVRKSNRPLRDIMERIGCVHEGTKRTTDILMYGLLASDAARWMKEENI